MSFSKHPRDDFPELKHFRDATRFSFANHRKQFVSIDTVLHNGIRFVISNYPRTRAMRYARRLCALVGNRRAGGCTGRSISRYEKRPRFAEPELAGQKILIIIPRIYIYRNCA